MKKLNILFQSSPNYSGNSKIMYDYIKEKYKNKVNLYWAIGSRIDYDRLKDKLNCVMYGSTEMIDLMDTIDVIFTTHGQLREYKKEGQIYINLWHGIGMKKLGYMLQQKNLAPQDQRYLEQLQMKTDYIIVPSKFWQLIFCAIFSVNYNQILPIGCPKLDPLVKTNGKDNLEKILNMNLSHYKKIIYYMPTFRKGCNRLDSNPNLNNILNLEEYDESLLINYLEENDYLLCIKYHPDEEELFNFNIYDNVKIIKEEQLQEYEYSVYDILNAADMLITDYSSLGIEFTIIDKPVIYIDSDIEDYQKNRGLIFDDKNFWFQNNNVSSIDGLLEKLSIGLKNKKYHSEMKKLWFGNLNDGGLENICNYFFTAKGELRANICSIDNFPARQEKEITKLKEKKDFLERLTNQYESELNMIYNSKSWKILEKLRKIKNKIFHHKKEVTK